jgi:CMP-N-acetylneuraminic acid synthetase
VIIIVIPAKGQSSRLENKNMTILEGRPMLGYTIDWARQSSATDAIYVTTDSDEIADFATAEGVAVIRRPQSLGGDVPVVDVYRHALDSIAGNDDVEIVVGLQPDHPDRDVAVDETIELLKREGADRVISKQADGEKNGAHYVMTRHFVETGESRKDTILVDDCTNVHFETDLQRAQRRLRVQKESRLAEERGGQDPQGTR